jgi:nicotinamide mononucleotide transporter
VGILGCVAQLALDLMPEVRLYPDAVLQGIFVVLSLVGWATWRSRVNEPLRVRHASAPLILLVAASSALGALALGGFFASIMPSLWPHIPPSNYPYADSTATVLSVFAQLLLARRFTLNWLLWIVVDVILIAVFWRLELLFMALQYLIFLGLATAGYFAWHKAPSA